MDPLLFDNIAFVGWAAGQFHLFQTSMEEAIDIWDNMPLDEKEAWYVSVRSILSQKNTLQIRPWE